MHFFLFSLSVNFFKIPTNKLRFSDRATDDFLLIMVASSTHGLCMIKILSFRAFSIFKLVKKCK